MSVIDGKQYKSFWVENIDLMKIDILQFSTMFIIVFIIAASDRAAYNMPGRKLYQEAT